MLTPSQLSVTLKQFIAMPRETEWLEFKCDFQNPEEIGEYISALSNSAALHKKEAGFLIWGIADNIHEVVGTHFQPRQAKKGNEELENWLLRLLQPRIDFSIHEFDYDGKHIVLFEILISRRWWCRYVCPGGALYGLIGWARPVRVVHATGKCTRCAACVRVCPVGLNPMDDRMGRECDNCGLCVSNCKDKALNYGIRLSKKGGEASTISY